MSYLDPKERVIDMKMTSYGRHLLSLGKFKPTYYAFFDDDVIYDGEYASINEGQDNIEPRIQENTPRMACQAIFSSRETAVFESSPNVINDLIIGQDIQNLKEKDKQQLLAKTRITEGPEQSEVLQQPLGTTDSVFRNMPAWNARFYKAPLSSSVNYLQISSSAGRGVTYKDIPQLNVDIQYTINKNSPTYTNTNANSEYIGSGARQDKISYIIPEDTIFLGDGGDGGIIEVVRDVLIVRLEESNTNFNKDNFEIECYEVETVDGEEFLTPLDFYNDIELMIKDELGTGYKEGTVQRYFDFFIDSEIPSEEICPYITTDTTPQIFDTPVIDCETKDMFPGDISVDIYSDIDDTEDFCE